MSNFLDFLKEEEEISEVIFNESCRDVRNPKALDENWVRMGIFSELRIIRKILHEGLCEQKRQNDEYFRANKEGEAYRDRQEKEREEIKALQSRMQDSLDEEIKRVEEGLLKRILDGIKISFREKNNG